MKPIALLTIASFLNAESALAASTVARCGGPNTQIEFTIPSTTDMSATSFRGTVKVYAVLVSDMNPEYGLGEFSGEGTFSARPAINNQSAIEIDFGAQGKMGFLFSQQLTPAKMRSSERLFSLGGMDHAIPDLGGVGNVLREDLRFDVQIHPYLFRCEDPN